MPIVATKALFFKSDKVPDSLSSIYTSRTPTISEVTVVATKSPDEIVTRTPIDKEKLKFQPVTTTVLPSDKVSSSLSSSSIPVPRKPSPVKTDHTHPRLVINVPEYR